MCIFKFLILYYHFHLTEGGKDLRNISCIFGLKPINCEGSLSSDGIPILYAGEETKLHVFGNKLTSTSEIGFTYEDDCDYPIPSKLQLSSTLSSYRGFVSFTPLRHGELWTMTKYYVCLKDVALNNSGWVHQGKGKQVSLYVSESFSPLWMYILLITFCFLLSALLTGLNLGLMSLDVSELQLLKRAGTPKERKYAAKIIPVRKNGNYLVCSIVITSTLCNAVSTVVCDEFLPEIVTIILSTTIIVLFCEIFPQSICSAYPLHIGGRTIYVTRACMILTYPISYPLSMLLNCIVGKELAKSYNKERLRELLKKTKLPSHEEKIISGTLDFSNKTVDEVMTVLDDVYKLPITAIMDFETISGILASGYSRIPIYVGNKSNIQYLLLTKDLALINPDEKVPVKVLVQKPHSYCQYVPKGTALDKVLGRFKESRNHMLFVVDHETGSDKKVCVGLVTFEDIIEEIFQMEILDETDTIFDNRGKRRLSNTIKIDLMSLFSPHKKANAPSENVKLSTYCFLTEIEEFSLHHVSPKVVISLLNLDIYYTTSGNKQSQDTIFVSGVPADYFVMILEGQMDVKIGNEGLVFEAGAFRYFGVEALRKGSAFTPDYTLQSSMKTLYLKIPTALYKAALLATRYERFKESPNISHESEIYKYFSLIIGSDAMASSLKK